MPRCFSTSIQSEVAWRELFLAFTVPAIWMAPPNSNSFSVSVVFPASGCEMMAKVRRRDTSLARALATVVAAGEFMVFAKAITPAAGIAHGTGQGETGRKNKAELGGDYNNCPPLAPKMRQKMRESTRYHRIHDRTKATAPAPAPAPAPAICRNSRLKRHPRRTDRRLPIIIATAANHANFTLPHSTPHHIIGSSMFRLIASICIAIVVLLAPALSRAADLGPDEIVRQVTADVLESVQKDKQLQSGDRRRALALAEEKILPLIDFEQATQLAVGRAWRQATPEQRARLVMEFRSMLVRIYSNALGVYRGQTMRVQPVRMAKDATDVTVRNQYLSPGKPPLAVDYSMRKVDGTWKIYDIVAEGISLVLTYRGEFEQVVQQGGIDGLIKQLAEKNAPPRERSSS